MLFEMAKGGCDMKTRRPVFARVVILLLVAMLGGLLGGSRWALADSSVAVAIFGTVDGAPEGVYVSGVAQITSKVMKVGPKFNHPRSVMLSIDLHNVSGQGLSTGATYVITGQDEVLRQLVASDLVEITFPLYPDEPGGFTSARAGLASFTLTFDVSTGALTGGTATVSTPYLPEGAGARGTAPEAFRRPLSQSPLLLLDQHRPPAGHARRAQGLCREVRRRARLVVSHRQRGRHQARCQEAGVDPAPRRADSGRAPPDPHDRRRSHRPVDAQLRRRQSPVSCHDHQQLHGVEESSAGQELHRGLRSPHARHRSVRLSEPLQRLSHRWEGRHGGPGPCRRDHAARAQLARALA